MPSKRHRQLATCLLFTTANAQKLQQLLPVINHKEGTLTRHLKDGQAVVYDFKPAFPHYDEERLRELLLIREKDVASRVKNETDEGEGSGEVHSDSKLAGNEEVSDQVVESAIESDETLDDEVSETDRSTGEEDELLSHQEVPVEDTINSNKDSIKDVQGETKITTEDVILTVSITEEIADELSADDNETPKNVVDEMKSEEAESAAEEILHHDSAGDEGSETKEIGSSLNEEPVTPMDSVNEDATSTAADSIQSETEEDIAHEFSGEEIVSDSTFEDNENPSDDPDILKNSDNEDESKSQVASDIDDVNLDTQQNEIEEDVPERDESSISHDKDSAMYATPETQQVITEQQKLDEDKITINYDKTPPSKDTTANQQFITGLDEIDKLFESVSPPDELDVGADGSSIQDVLVGQGLKIIFKRAKSFGKDVKKRFEGVVQRAVPQRLVSLASGEEEEEERLDDILKMMQGDLMNAKQDVADKVKKKTEDDCVEPTNNDQKEKIENRFPLLKKPQVNKIFKFAQRKWQQAKQLFDEFFSIFHSDEEEVDFTSDLGNMNFDDVRSLVEKNRLKIKEGVEMPKFGSEVDDSFIRERAEAMMKLQEKNRHGVGTE